METFNTLHETAVDMAQEAFLKQKKGLQSQALALFREALEYEKRAVDAIFKNNIGEPARSIVIRSAASLALNAMYLRQAEKLASLGLLGDPPVEIAEELREIMALVDMRRKQENKQPELDGAGVKLQLAGGLVCFR